MRGRGKFWKRGADAPLKHPTLLIQSKKNKEARSPA
jgi:hypothetical protein